MADRIPRLLWLTALLATLIAPATAARAGDPSRDYTALITQDTLEAHVRALAVDIGARPAGSEAEEIAARYIAAQFAGWGYTVQRQAVPFGGTSTRVSQNVIATKAATAPNDQTQTIIIGAHMDSVTAGTGADDNATGVATILAAAEALAELDTRHDLVFVAFGAEETERRGSRAYVAALTPDALSAIMVMVNVDTVGAGDFAYVYAGALDTDPPTPGPTWARDLALATAADLGHDLRTTPPESWNGFTGPWSDHYAFVEQGIAVAYFERWNWNAGSNPLWGVETADRGDILHTAHDQIGAVDAALIEPVAETLAAMIAQIATGDVTPA